MEKYIYFNDIFQDYTKYSLKIPKNMYLKSGLYPIIDQGKEEIAGFSNQSTDIFNDVPVIIFGDHTRIFKYIDYPFFLGADGVKILKNISNLFLDKFLYYSLKNFKIPNTGYNRHFKWLKNFKIKYISLIEQKKIVNIIEKIEAFILQKKEQLNYLKKLNKSLFTRMFGTPEYNEKGWNFISLKDISYTKGEYGSNKPAINYNGGYRYIRITDINATGELKTEKVGVSDEEIEAQKYALKENDILFARSGATVGKNFLYNKKYGKCIFAGYLIRFKLNPHLISTKYLKIYLDTNYYWNWVKNCQNIVAQPNINAKQYGEDLKIMLPPIELQNKFAERVEKIEKLSFNFY